MSYQTIIARLSLGALIGLGPVGCAGPVAKAIDIGSIVRQARSSCEQLKKTRLKAPVQTRVDEELERIDQARARGKEKVAYVRARQLKNRCRQETKQRTDVAVISREIERSRDRLAPPMVARFDELVSKADYAGAIWCGEGLLQDQPHQCSAGTGRPAGGHRPVANGGQDEELLVKHYEQEVESSTRAWARPNRMAVSLAIGLGTAALGRQHVGAEDVKTAFDALNPDTPLDEAPTSNLQVNGQLAVRYYFPYYLFGQLGLGTVYNSASSAFDDGAGTLSNNNVGLELPILVGLYRPLIKRIYLYGAVGPSILVWSRALWDSEPDGTAPDFKSNASIGALFLGGLDFLLTERWALGLELGYRLLKSGELVRQDNDETLLSWQLRGDQSNETYDLDLSGFTAAIHLRFFAL